MTNRLRLSGTLACTMFTLLLFIAGSLEAKSATNSEPSPETISAELLDAWYLGDADTVNRKLHLLEYLATNASEQDARVKARYLVGLGWRDYSTLASEKNESIERLKTATGHLEKAIELNPENAEAHALLANVYRRLVGAGNRDSDTIHKAIEHREKANEIAPENPVVLMLEASALVSIPEGRGGNVNDGISAGFEAIGRFQMSDSTKTKRQEAETWATIGLGYRKARQNRRAIRAYENALKAQPKWNAIRDRVIPGLEDAN